MIDLIVSMGYTKHQYVAPLHFNRSKEIPDGSCGDHSFQRKIGTRVAVTDERTQRHLVHHKPNGSAGDFADERHVQTTKETTNPAVARHFANDTHRCQFWLGGVVGIGLFDLVRSPQEKEYLQMTLEKLHWGQQKGNGRSRPHGREDELGHCHRIGIFQLELENSITLDSQQAFAKAV